MAAAPRVSPQAKEMGMAVCDEELRDQLESALASASAAVSTSLGQLRQAKAELDAASSALAEAEDVAA